MNGQMDILMILVHCVLFWLILIFAIEMNIFSYICCCCDSSRMKRTVVSYEDNDDFLSQMSRMSQSETPTPGGVGAGVEPPKADDELSSESAQIIGESDGGNGTKQLQLRFKRKQKPG